MIVYSKYLCVMILALLFGFVAPLNGQKNRPRPTSQPAVALFRCPGDCSAGDRIVGDGTDYRGTGVPETGQGAHFGVDELWIGFGEGVYKLTLDFSQLDGTAPCSINGTCRLPLLPSPVVVINQENGEIQSNVLGANGQPTANGMLDVGVGQSLRTA